MARRSTKEVWDDWCFRLAELAAHTGLSAAIIIFLYSLQWLNHYLMPPTGVTLFEGHVPVDWGFSASDVWVLGRYVWLSIWIFSEQRGDLSQENAD